MNTIQDVEGGYQKPHPILPGQPTTDDAIDDIEMEDRPQPLGYRNAPQPYPEAANADQVTPGLPVYGQPIPDAHIPARQPRAGATSACGTVTVLVFAILAIPSLILPLLGDVFYIEPITTLVGVPPAVAVEVSFWRYCLHVQGTAVPCVSVGSWGTGDGDRDGLAEMKVPFQVAVVLHIAAAAIMAVIAVMQVLRLAGCLRSGSNKVLRAFSGLSGIAFFLLTVVAHVLVHRAVSNNYRALEMEMQVSHNETLITVWDEAYIWLLVSSYAFSVVFIAFSLRTFAGDGCHNCCCCNCCSCAYIADESEGLP